jgi:hypothetical protein
MICSTLPVCWRRQTLPMPTSDNAARSTPVGSNTGPWGDSSSYVAWTVTAEISLGGSPEPVFGCAGRQVLSRFAPC